MARHARHARLTTPPTRSVVGKAITLGIVPALALSALGPTATALTTDQTPERATGATDSALADAATTDASIETLAVTEAPAVETERVADVTEAAPEPAAEAATVEEGVVVLDTTDTAGRAAGTVEAPDGFQTVGAAWPRELGTTVPELQVRTRSSDGTWTGWTHLEMRSDGADEESAIASSAPLYVGESDAVQIATVDPRRSVPVGVELTLVSSDQVTTEAATTSGAVAAAAETVGPTIITRDEWGANPQCDLGEDYTGATWRPAPGGLKAASVHHTVNPNDYDTVAEAMQAIKNDQVYHQQTNGWCDIGYNFLVDKWGNVYEGAAGSIDEAIIGAHTGGFNTGTVGVAMLGTFTAEAGMTPTGAQQAAVADIAAYRLAEYDVAPTGNVTLTSAGKTAGGRYEAGTQVPLDRIFSHRDTHFTECPGEMGYEVLPAIRAQAAERAVVHLSAEAVANLVQSIYKDALGREATVGEVAFWQADVAADGPTRLIAAMEASTKYRKARIVNAYKRLLGFTPTAARIDAELRLIVSGQTVDEVDMRLMSSSTYYRAEGGTDAAYVRALYAEMLGRVPTKSQTTLWTGRLATQGRAAVVRSIWNNPQATSRRVVAAYQHYLGVNPTSGQSSYWVERLSANDRSDAAMRAAITATDKYAARADARY